MTLINIFQRLWDEFNGTELGTLMWQPISGTNAGITVGGGVATLSLAASANSFTHLESALFHDAEYSQFFAQITPPTMSGTKYFRMQLVRDSNNLVEMFMSGTANLVMRVRNGGVNSDTSIAYNGTTHRWWRMREISNTWYFDTSPDGLTWTNRRTAAIAVPGTNVKAIFETGHTTGTITADTAVIDNVNIRPGTRIFRDDMQIAGDVTLGNMQFGTVDITPTANTPTLGIVSGFSLQGTGTVIGIVTPFTAVPGTAVLGVTINSVSATGMNVWLLRNNTTLTTVYWMMWRNQD